MAAGWIIKRNNKENGPFTSQQLKKLAVSGKLKREDLIRKEPGGKFMRANSLKGLFPEEELEEADAADSADFLSVDISRYGDLPMEDDEDEDEGPPRKRRSQSGKTPPRSGGKRKKSGKGKGKKGSKEVDWEDDPVNELYSGSILVFFAVGMAFFMNPEEYELPEIVVKIHEHAGRFGVSAFLLLVSLVFFVPAFRKISRLNAKGQSIPWRMPYLGWLFSSSEEDDEGEE